MANTTTLLNIKQVAEKLSVSVMTVRRLVANGRIPVTIVGTQHRFKASAIDTYIESNTTKTKPLGAL